MNLIERLSRRELRPPNSEWLESDPLCQEAIAAINALTSVILEYRTAHDIASRLDTGKPCECPTCNSFKVALAKATGGQG